MPRVTTLLFSGLLALLSGCAVTTIRDDGTREIFGLVSMTLPPATTPDKSAGETIEVSTVGLLLFVSPVGSGIALGYAREQVTGLRNNALVIVGPDGTQGKPPVSMDSQPAMPDADSNDEGSK